MNYLIVLSLDGSDEDSADDSGSVDTVAESGTSQNYSQRLECFYLKIVLSFL